MTENRNDDKVKVVIEPESPDSPIIMNSKKPPKVEKEKDTIFDWIKTIAAALLIAFVIKTFIMDATRVAGNSMLNTLHNGDMLLVNKIGKAFTPYHRGEIVILEAPDYPGRLYVKRIVGEPGDTIELKDDTVYLNGERLSEPYISVETTLPTSEYTQWVLGEDMYFVMGDNRMEGASNDSRNFGPVLKDELVGHAFVRFYPFSDMGSIDKTPYGNE